MRMKMNDIIQYKHVYDDVFIAPQGQAFYNEKGEYLGRFLWRKTADGVYLDKDLYI